MAHPRQQIREAVGVILSASPTNWKTCEETRIAPRRAIMPYLSAYCDVETLTPLSIHSPVVYQRDVNLTVVGNVRLAQDAEQFEDDLDNVQQEIEQTLTLTALQSQVSGVKSLILESSDTEIVDDDDKIYAAVTLTFTVRVNTLEGVPETLI